MPESVGEVPAADRDTIRAYETSVLAAIRQLAAGMRRVAALVRTIEAPGADPELRAMAVAECLSWRMVLDRLPAEPPPTYRPVHARVVRWSAVVAELGDLQVAALASAHPEDQHHVGRMAEQVAARYRDIVEAMERLAAVHRRSEPSAHDGPEQSGQSD